MKGFNDHETCHETATHYYGSHAGVLVCLVALGVGLYFYITQPLQDGARLGAVNAVVTGHVGPVAIAAYLFELGDGTVGLVDAGQDGEARAIRTVLARLGKSDLDLRAIFLTHAHDDHAGGTAAFPNAEVYAIEPDAGFIRRRREQLGVAVAMTKAVKDGDELDLHGTHVEVYALPGHTPGSAAFLVHGVLFLGDAAQGMREGHSDRTECFPRTQTGMTAPSKCWRNGLILEVLKSTTSLSGTPARLSAWSRCRTGQALSNEKIVERG